MCIRDSCGSKRMNGDEWNATLNVGHNEYGLANCDWSCLANTTRGITTRIGRDFEVTGSVVYDQIRKEQFSLGKYMSSFSEKESSGECRGSDAGSVCPATLNATEASPLSDRTVPVSLPLQPPASSCEDTVSGGNSYSDRNGYITFYESIFGAPASDESVSEDDVLSISQDTNENITSDCPKQNVINFIHWNVNGLTLSLIHI